MKYKGSLEGRRPWIVYRRALAVLIPIARCATREGALRRAAREHGGAFTAHVDEISPDLARALGVRS